MFIATYDIVCKSYDVLGQSTMSTKHTTSYLRCRRFCSLISHDDVVRTVCLTLSYDIFLPGTGQNNVGRSCSVIWSAVGVVCPAWSSGVDKLEVCLSQYFDSLFAYSSLGCFEMLSSGRSIFHCSSWGQVEELDVLMQLSIGLYFTSFISIAVLRLGLNGSVDSDAVFNFLLHCRKIETMSKSSGAVHFVCRLRWIWGSKLQFSCGWSLHCVFWYDDWSLLLLENVSVLAWSFGTFCLE